MSLKARALITAILLSPISAQLVPPTCLPDVSSNFQIIAHTARDNIPNFNNWEIRGIGNECNQDVVLFQPSANINNTTVISPSSFYFNGLSPSSISSNDETRMLYITNGIPRVVRLGCSVKQPQQIHISWKGDGEPPLLEYDEDGQFYACKTTVASETVGRLFYRSSSEKTPGSCVDVSLYSVCSHGPDREDGLMVTCWPHVEEDLCFA